MGPLGIWFTRFLRLILGEARFREIPAQMEKRREECLSFPFPVTPESRELALADKEEPLCCQGAAPIEQECFTKMAVELRDSATP